MPPKKLLAIHRPGAKRSNVENPQAAAARHYKQVIKQSVDLAEKLRNPKLTLMQRRTLEKKQWAYLSELQPYTDKRDTALEAIISHTSAEAKSSTTLGDPKILMTITTCKRMDLLRRTLNSFLKCCLDLDKIHKIIMVDDHTDHKDLALIKSQYPFLEILPNTHGGHVQSLNLIVDYATKHQYEYIVQIEDDFHFFEFRRYISDCLDIFNDDSSIGQCVFTRDYIEAFDHLACSSTLDSTKAGKAYFIHKFIPDNRERNEYSEKRIEEETKELSGDLVIRLHSYYYPNFSLRPMMIRRSVYDRIGKFFASWFFEIEYATIYSQLGYRTAFLPTICHEHIGKKTYETVGSNAYELNDKTYQAKKWPNDSVFVVLDEWLLKNLEHKKRLLDTLPISVFVKIIMPNMVNPGEMDQEYFFLPSSSSECKNKIEPMSIDRVRSYCGLFRDIGKMQSFYLIEHGKIYHLNSKTVLDYVRQYGVYSFPNLLMPSMMISLNTEEKESVPKAPQHEAKSLPQSNDYPGWTKYEDVDSYGHDITRSRCQGNRLLDHAEYTEACTVVNSLGYMKRQLHRHLICLPGCNLYVRNTPRQVKAAMFGPTISTDITIARQSGESTIDNEAQSETS